MSYKWWISDKCTEQVQSINHILALLVHFMFCFVKLLWVFFLFFFLLLLLVCDVKVENAFTLLIFVFRLWNASWRSFQYVCEIVMCNFI